MVTETELREQLADALEDILCFCGNYKRMGKPFCFRCFDALPRNDQKLLTNSPLRHLESYQAHTYDAAKEWLKKYRHEHFKPTLDL